jgi:hypothetical protein
MDGAKVHCEPERGGANAVMTSRRSKASRRISKLFKAIKRHAVGPYSDYESSDVCCRGYLIALLPNAPANQRAMKLFRLECEEGAARPPGRNVTASGHEPCASSTPRQLAMFETCVAATRTIVVVHRRRVRPCPALGRAYTVCRSQPRLCRDPRSCRRRETGTCIYE